MLDQPSSPIVIPNSTTPGNLKWSWGSRKNVYRSFENAKTFARSLDLDGMDSYREFAKMYIKGGPLSGYRLLPNDMSNKPEEIYLDPYGTGKKFNWFDFLGVPHRRKNPNNNADGKWYLPYPEFKKRLLANNIQGFIHYRMWRVTDKFFQHLPKDPEQVYNEEWEGWTVVLGKAEYSLMDKSQLIMPIDQATKYVHALGLKTGQQYHDWWIENNRPAFLPAIPDLTYRKDWVSWPKFLGKTLEDKIDIKKLNVDVLVIARTKLGPDIIRIYVDERGSSHAIHNKIDGDQIVEMFKYHKSIHEKLMLTINQMCVATRYANTVVECKRVEALVRTINVMLEPVRWKEANMIVNGNVGAIGEQLAFADHYLKPGRDPVFDQRAYVFDPFSVSDGGILY